MSIESTDSQLNSFEDNYDKIDTLLLSIDDDSKVIFKKFRSDNSFYDVTFTCRNHVFDAHRIVMSSYSRWLRAILQSREKVILPVDFFEPISFGAIIEYMYGDYIFISVKNVEDILIITRKMEMQKLEQDIFQLLCSDIINESNCKYMLYLSERFDNTHLRHKAWYILQKLDPRYGSGLDLQLNNNSQSNYQRRNDDSINGSRTTLTATITGFTSPGALPVLPVTNATSGVVKAKTTYICQINAADSQHQQLPQKPSVALNVVQYWVKRLAAAGYDNCFSSSPSVPSHSQSMFNVDSTDFIKETGVVSNSSKILTKSPATLVATSNSIKQSRGVSHQQRAKVDAAMSSTSNTNSYENERENMNQRNDRDNHYTNSSKKSNLDNDISPRYHDEDCVGTYIHQTSSDNEEDEQETAEEDEYIDWVLLLTDVYRSMDMEERVAAVPKVLEAFSGRESDLAARLLVKYANQLSPMMKERLEEVLQ